MAQHERRPRATGNFSIERSFALLRDHLTSVRVIVAQSPYYSTGVWRRLANAWAATRISADVHHLTGDNGYLAFVLPARRTLLTVHDCIPDDVGHSWTRRLVRNLWIRWPAQRVSRVITPSAYTREALISLTGLSAEVITVIPTVVPALAPTPARPWGPVVRVLQIGTAPNKNIERLAEALAGLAVTFDIIGPLRASQQVALHAWGHTWAQRDRVTDDELSAAYAACDVVAMVSTLEGFGMPIIEAQRIGRPVLAARAASLPEVAGDGACLVDPTDIASIRAGFLRLCHEPEFRASLVARGTENARRFSVEAAAHAHTALYREVAGVSA